MYKPAESIDSKSTHPLTNINLVKILKTYYETIMSTEAKDCET